jgi:hypothetical protein
MKMNIKQQNLLLALGCSAWSGLGFIRGVQSYKYNHNKHIYNKSNNPEPIIYLNSICNGCFGILLYGNPFCLPISLYKEIYRLEVNIRKLETEKNTDFYNNLFL